MNTNIWGDFQIWIRVPSMTNLADSVPSISSFLAWYTQIVLSKVQHNYFAVFVALIFALSV